MRVIALVLLGVLAAGQMITPGATWARKTAQAAGFNPTKLEAALNYGHANGESYCVSVHRDGYIVGDKYWNGANYKSSHIIWSVSKAFVATMIGVAEREGKLHTSDIMSKWITDWKAPNPSAGVTMEEVLRHCSGRYYDPVTDFVTPQEQDDQTEFAIKLKQQNPPGTKDQYNQMAYQTLERVLKLANKEEVAVTTHREFFGPLQMESNPYWQMKSFFINKPQKVPPIYGGMTLSCADLARFGHLWLNRGKWGSHVVFTEEFYGKALSQPRAPFGLMRQYGNWAWHDPGNYSRAIGLGNNFVAYNIKHGLVLTRIGFPTSISEHFSYNTFMDSVLASLTNTTDPAVLEAERANWVVHVDRHHDE